MKTDKEILYMNSSVIQFLNQYSFLFLMALILVGGTLYLRRKQVSRPWWGVWGVFALANVGVVALLPTPAATLSRPMWELEGGQDLAVRDEATGQPLMPESAEEVEAIIGAHSGRPMLIEFYSDFGLG
jgi:hypothetical protein